MCERCGNHLTGRQTRWCSRNCSKLGLKALWRKRTKENRNAYARQYRRAKNGGNRPLTYSAKYRDTECLRCKDTEDLQACHVKPLWAGGNHKNIITLCRTCHSQFDNLLRDFWKQAIL